MAFSTWIPIIALLLTFALNIPVTYGSDSHGNYADDRGTVESYLRSAGFVEGDISDLSEKDFWH